MPKPVALILLNWNTPVHTANCIASLQQYCNEQYFDIIVVDNGSTDNSITILKAQYPDLIYIENGENLGFAEGNNRGIEYSIAHDYPYSLVLNTDTLVDEDIVVKLSDHLNNHPEAAAVQPAIFWLHDKTKIWNGKGGFNQLLGITFTGKNIPQATDEFEVAQWVTGCCMLLRNSALVKTGLFNKEFFLYYEDVELSYRLRDRTYEVHYLPSCKMYHEAGVSAQVGAPAKEGFLSPVIHYYISRNRIWFLRNYGNVFYYPVYIITSAIYYLALWIYFILKGRNKKAQFLFKGVKEGLFAPKNLIWPK
ncbi:glycosyltransferase family 2 protein [Mucilaginibacter puniceus]